MVCWTLSASSASTYLVCSRITWCTRCVFGRTFCSWLTQRTFSSSCQGISSIRTFVFGVCRTSWPMTPNCKWAEISCLTWGTTIHWIEVGSGWTYNVVSSCLVLALPSCRTALTRGRSNVCKEAIIAFGWSSCGCFTLEACWTDFTLQGSN